MRYPSYKTYEKIYQKYINPKNLKEMLDLAGKDFTDKNFLDICCGNGNAIKEAKKRKAKFRLGIDQETKMVPIGIKHLNLSVELVLEHLGDYTNNKIFDIVFCRQGINYWFTSDLIRGLVKHMANDGVFIFNTFNTKPTREPLIKEYAIDAVTFVEISYLVEDNTVHHVQIREGYSPHITQFKWIREEEFKNGLAPDFNFEIRRKRNTDIYICRKK